MAALKSVIRSCKDNPKDTIYTATGENLAQDFIRTCKNFCNDFGIQTISESSQQIVFPTGARILGISSRPDQLHGRTNCCVILDEFSRHDNPKELLIAAEPITTWGNPIEIISTVSNPVHLFYQKYNEALNNKTMYKPFRTDIYQAVKDGLAVQIYFKQNNKMPENIKECNEQWIEQQRNKVSSYVWSQQYECLPSDSNSYIVPMSIYKKLATKVLNILPEQECWVGIDVGVTKNYTCVWVISKKDNKFKTEYVRWMKGVGVIEQINILKELFRGKNIKKICIDQGSQGHTIAVELKKEFGSIILPFSFNNNNKMEMAELVRKVTEEERISLPDDEVIMNDICSMATKENVTGTVRYNGGSKLDDDNHADCFWALAMALHTANVKSLVYAV